MTNNEIIQQLSTIRSQIDTLLTQITAPILGCNHKVGPTFVPKHVGGLVPNTIKLVSSGQLGMFYAIRKKHGVTDEAKEAVLKEKYQIVQECDLPFDKAQSYREDLLNFATQYNPHFPIEKFLSDGSINPAWAKKEGGE